jgi:hypothetical protein
MFSILTAAKCKKGSNVSHVLQTFQQRHQVQKIVICRIVDPAFYGYGIV